MRGATAGRLIACFLALLAALPARAEGPAHSPNPLRIAVFDVRATGVEESTARTISEVLAVEVSKVPNTTVITNAEIESLLGLERKKQMLGCSDDVSCVAEIAGSLGVDKICTGSLGKISGTTVLTLRVIDVRSAKVDNRLYEKEKVDAAGFLERMPDIVAKLFPGPLLAAKSAPQPKEEPKPEAKVEPAPAATAEEPKAQEASAEAPKADGAAVENASYVPLQPFAAPPAPVDEPHSFRMMPYLQNWKTWAISTGVFFLLSGATYRTSPPASSGFALLTLVSGGLATSTCVCHFPFGKGADAPPVAVVRPEPTASAE